MYEPGEIKAFNPDKDRAREEVLDPLIRHRDAFIQARLGIEKGNEVSQLSDNQRVLNKVRGLNLIIAVQREMINISRSQIEHNCKLKWKKKYKTEKEQQENPFEEEENDFKELMEWRDFLKSCQQAIIQAEKTPSKEDDFMVTRVLSNGEEINELTINYYDMIDDLEDSSSGIRSILFKHKIISAGMEEDEEMSYKEKEQEAIRRVKDA